MCQFTYSFSIKLHFVLYINFRFGYPKHAESLVNWIWTMRFSVHAFKKKTIVAEREITLLIKDDVPSYTSYTYWDGMGWPVGTCSYHKYQTSANKLMLPFSLEEQCLLARSLMIGWLKKSWNPQRVSSVVTLSVCLCVRPSVRERATGHTFTPRNLIFGLNDPWDMRKKKIFFCFSKFSFLRFL